MMPADTPKFHEISAPHVPVTVPALYCNGFINNVGVSDMSIILLLDATPIMKLHLSYTAAKSLSKLLTNAVGMLEKATSHDIMVSEEVEKNLRQFSGESK